MAPATGEITIDGQPMIFGRVQFDPIAQGDPLQAGKSGFGFLDAEGNFSISTYKDGDGAHIGEHRVILSSRSRAANTAGKEASKKFPKFVALRITGQEFEVIPGQENHFKIAITSDQIRDFGEQE